MTRRNVPMAKKQVKKPTKSSTSQASTTTNTPAPAKKKAKKPKVFEKHDTPYTAITITASKIQLISTSVFIA